MDNEKTPGYIKEILEKRKAARLSQNETNAIDEKKALDPIKDAANTLPDEAAAQKKLETILDKNSISGRGRGGDTTTPSTQSDGEHKTPTQKILERGEQKPFRGRSGGGLGGSDDLLKDKKDFINPDDILSEKGTGKQPKQELQQQVGQEEPSTKHPPTLLAKDLLNKIKEAREQPMDMPAKEISASKGINQPSIQERIAKATAAKEQQAEKNNLLNQKGVQVSDNKVKTPEPKSPKI